MFSDIWKGRLTRVFDWERHIIVVQFSCPLKTAIETYILLMILVRRGVHGFRMAGDRLEHMSFASRAPYIIHNLFNWNETYYSKCRNDILKELVELVTGGNDEDAFLEDAFLTVEKIFRRIMKRNISPK